MSNSLEVSTNVDYSQFRSNFVARWEYKPGSTVYLVWSHARSEKQHIGDYSLGENMNHIFDVFPDNIFLVKLNYWLSI